MGFSQVFFMFWEDDYKLYRIKGSIIGWNTVELIKDIKLFSYVLRILVA